MTACISVHSVQNSSAELRTILQLLGDAAHIRGAVAWWHWKRRLQPPLGPEGNIERIWSVFLQTENYKNAFGAAMTLDGTRSDGPYGRFFHHRKRGPPPFSTDGNRSIDVLRLEPFTYPLMHAFRFSRTCPKEVDALALEPTNHCSVDEASFE